ncbi:hypothetical protein FOZ63_013975, partial [Perkinsus olseni]
MTKPEIDPSVAEAIEETLREVVVLRPADPVAFMADRLAAKSKLNVDDYAAAHSERIRSLRYDVDWCCPPGVDPFTWVPVAYCDVNSTRNLRERAESFWKVVLEDPQHTIDRTALREV